MARKKVDATAAAIAAHRAALTRWPDVSMLIDDAGGRFTFDAAEADRACDFFATYLSHHAGEFDGAAFALADWQRELIVRPVFGWKRMSDGRRRFRRLYLEVPKKNGKSKLSAGIALFLLFCDREPGAEIVCAAADREQAALVFDDSKTMVETNPELAAMAEVFRRSIVVSATRSSFKVVSADVRTKHGPNIHGLIMDEFHAQPDRELYDTLAKGIAARRQPLVVLITTAGNEMESICREEHDYAEKVRTGVVEADTYLPVIFGANLDDDWTSPAVWTRANPSLGTTVKRDYLEAECRAAMAEPRKQNAFKRLHLNIWTQQTDVWIPLEDWDACAGELSSAAPLAVAAGLDLSSKYDLTAFVVVRKYADARPTESVAVVADDADDLAAAEPLNVDFRVDVIPFFWLPEDTLYERVRTDRVPYDVWRSQGLLRVTPGAVVDYERVYRDIVTEIGPRYGLTAGEIGFDPYNANNLTIALRDRAGYRVMEIPQTVQRLSAPAKLFEMLIRSRRLTHDGHRVLRWNVSNVAVKEDKNENIYPFKAARTKRIDGVMAAIMGLQRVIHTAPAEPESVYLRRGVLSLGDFL